MHISTLMEEHRLSVSEDRVLRNIHEPWRKEIQGQEQNCIVKRFTKYYYVVKSSVFWDILPCSQLKVNQPFGRKCRLDHQGQKISQARDDREAGSKKVKPRRMI
jgi:hypothetical protein